MDTKEIFQFLSKRGKVHPDDKERNALFLIVSRNKDLFDKVNHIYDFQENVILPDCIDSDDVDFSSSSRALLKLGFNLYNGYPADIHEVFSLLDEDQTDTALEAIRYRYSR